MGKIRIKTLGNEDFERKQAGEDKKRREAKDLKKGKAHIKGVGLKGGQQIHVMEGVELKPEVESLLHETPGSQEKEKKAKKAKAKVRSKRYKFLLMQIDKKKSYPLKEALQLLKKTATTHFDATVEAHVNLNPATLAKEKLSLSGSVNLPHGTGSKRKIVVADDNILTQIENGKIDFDVLVAHPSMMPKLAKFAKVLGPKGLMPNPKNGTVTPDPEKRAQELEGGEIAWKTEPDHPVIHQALGKVSFTETQIEKNIQAFVKSIGTSKIAKITLSSTMGPGIKVDITRI